jgi:MtN3 and saliva related transmembrane protein
MQPTDVLGYLAGTLTTVALVPQAWRAFRTRDVSGISLRMYCIFTLGIAIWLAYGIVLGETPMILANSLSLVLALAVLVAKLKYGRGDRAGGGSQAARA